MRKTKIVCTLGPATETPERLRQLLGVGMDVARLNFSHGSHAWHQERIQLLRGLARELDRPLAVLQDLSGPKLRIGDFPGEVDLIPERRCILTPGPSAAEDPPRINVPIPALLAALRPDDHVYLADGVIDLRVEEKRGEDVVCQVAHGGPLSGRKGIAAPSVEIDLPAFTEKDARDLKLGVAEGVDWVALSFVRSAADVAPARELVRAAGKEIPLLAKIEKREAVERLDEILDVVDGILIARGDLGVEMPLRQVPIIQKEIIRRCNEFGKPVVTATQMLESMTRNPTPTRAEVSDVANAIFDGTDAVMLSGETAVGDFPVEAARTMAEIARWTEDHLDYAGLLERRLRHRAETITDAISQGTAEIAADLEVAAIICSTSSGTTARMVSRTRPRAPIIAATSREETYRRLCLTWGVRPLVVPLLRDADEMLAATVAGAREAGLVKEGDTVVLTSGVHVGIPGGTNLIKVEKL